VQAVQRAGVPFQTRTAEEFADIAFARLDLVPPGLVAVSEWRPETEEGRRPLPSEVAYYGAVGRKSAWLAHTGGRYSGRKFPASRTGSPHTPTQPDAPFSQARSPAGRTFMLLRA
jgi:hypothetical protein